LFPEKTELFSEKIDEPSLREDHVVRLVRKEAKRDDTELVFFFPWIRFVFSFCRIIFIEYGQEKYFPAPFRRVKK